MCILFSCIVKCEEGSMGYRESSFDKFTILLPVLSCLLSPKKVALHDVRPIPGKLEFIQMFIFSGIEFFEEIKEALVEKMCFQIFGDILLKCWCKCQVRSTDTTRFSVSEIQVEGLFRDSYQLGYSDNCNQFWLLFHQKKPRLVLNLLLYPRDCLCLCTVVRVCGISLLFIICDIADISHRMTSELVINQHWISSQSYYLFFSDKGVRSLRGICKPSVIIKY